MSTSPELLHPHRLPDGKIRAVIFDFDGTFSTLRCGWEKVMRQLMLELICGEPPYSEEWEARIDAYIDASTGIQTVHQMQWLKDETEKAGRGAAERDVWWYKDAYNHRLLQQVNERIRRLEQKSDDPAQYLIAGAVDFVLRLREKGIAVYLASGTDHKDVVHEATVLGVAEMFSVIKGAPERQIDCSKKAVLQQLLDQSELPADSILMVGDGKVEIALGAEHGTYTLGVATDEEHLRGLNPVKRERLIKAGADAVIGDFENTEALFGWLGI